MSHNKERKEKTCLNCGSALHGRYCYMCGQENIEPKETVWGLLSHYAYDITHFDGKFFSTVKYLLTKPGFLTSEFIRGRRAAYLHPIRMYVFIAAFFFLIFFLIFNPSEIMKREKSSEVQLSEFMQADSSLRSGANSTKDSVMKAAMERTIVNIERKIASLRSEIETQKKKDSINLIKKGELVDSLGRVVPGLEGLSGEIAKNVKKIDSSKKEEMNLGPGTKLIMGDFIFNSQIAFDSLQQELPQSHRSNWFERALTHRAITLNNKWKNNKNELATLFMERFMHTLPQALFVSLPVFAFLLLILYARRKFYYVDHIIFTIHFYCASFLLLLVYFGFDKLKVAIGWQWISIVKTLLMLGIFFYLYKAMRRFYGQGRFKTILKFLILNFFVLIVFTILTFLFFILSLVELT